ncbi:hypothetical protein RB195_006849 [Necator americanus]|uniref:Alpha-carbonic anhydrase domain-containing protein n=1 Tax=Necator americanus TaxID=51031 RepID=A0ABR1BUI1_NECAM
MVPEKLSLWIRLLIVFCEFWLVTAEHWNYENTNWNDLCEYGKRQSPVNLDLSKVVVTHERPLEFHHYDIEDHIEVTNNGHTEVVQGFQSWTERPYISGGGLHGIYYLQQFHFHWGTSDLTGSEHTLDLLHYPMEYRSRPAAVDVSGVWRGRWLVPTFIRETLQTTLVWGPTRNVTCEKAGLFSLPAFTQCYEM